MDIFASFTDKIRGDCGADDTYYGLVMAATHAVPAIVTLSVYMAGFWSKDILFSAVGIMLTLNHILNYTLQLVINRPPPDPACGGERGSPPFAVQHIAVVLVIAYEATSRYPDSFPREIVGYTTAVLHLSAITSQTSGAASIEQVYLGIGVGVLAGFALFWSVLWVFIIYGDAMVAMAARMHFTRKNQIIK